ncbi:MAG: HelD family protein [Chitinophagales bacterium]
MEVTSKAVAHSFVAGQADKYRRMLASPFFGRFDWREGSSPDEPIYLGIGTVQDGATGQVMVCDWRAPICSVFYRHELGPAHYDAPVGRVYGEVVLKRQYKIEDSKLKYFFDCSVPINDEMLQRTLAGNASPKMRSIVETIQREQDVIIRDTKSDLLIVQSVAGSGKTSIALHRIAFLLYPGLGSNLSPANICIVSPGEVFSEYVSAVLPELGEENVAQTTFADVAHKALGRRLTLETRERQLEFLIVGQGTESGAARQNEIRFKGSPAMVKLLDRLLRHYERRMIPLDDVFFDGTTVMTRQHLKNYFLRDEIGLPMARRLARIERILLDRLEPLQKRRLERIQRIVAEKPEHQLEVKSFSRFLAMKAARGALDQLKDSLSVDFLKIYKALWEQPGLLARLGKGLGLPQDAEAIAEATRERLARGSAAYEDLAPLIYLRLKVEGSDLFPEIRHVVIDEAQDYSAVQYAVFGLLFKGARFTVLGDVDQAISDGPPRPLRESVPEAMAKSGRVAELRLEKTYRSSYEIFTFARRIFGGSGVGLSFERHEEKPEVRAVTSLEEMAAAAAGAVKAYLQQGYGTVAVICKTEAQTQEAHARLRRHIDLRRIDPSSGALERGACVISAAMAKGLEFDAVVVWEAGEVNYSTELDRRLLYVACTRALHRLSLFHTGEKSPFLR